jgi:hypothetical protein
MVLRRSGSFPASGSSPANQPPAVPNNLWRLANAAQNVNELSDRLTEQVSEIESAINKLNLGVDARVDVEVSSQDGFDRITRLRYGKASGKWGFIIEEFVDQSPEETYQEWAFKEAPRELRLKVVEWIPKLLDDLVNTSLKLASAINDKITLAKGLISLLPQPGPSGSNK